MSPAARTMRPLGLVSALFLGLGVVMLALRDPRPPAAAPAAPPSLVTPLELATLLTGPPGEVVVVDLSRAPGPLHLRGALTVDPAHADAIAKVLDRSDASPLARVVLVLDGEAPPTLLQGLQRAGRRVAVLRGGAAAWQREILAPQPPATADEAALRDFRRRAALSRALTGRASEGEAPPPPSSPAPKQALPRQQRSGGSSGC